MEGYYVNKIKRDGDRLAQRLERRDLVRDDVPDLDDFSGPMRLDLVFPAVRLDRVNRVRDRPRDDYIYIKFITVTSASQSYFSSSSPKGGTEEEEEK